ncbi:T9SS type A sorting domain-containing protein [Ferruginibacter profundus]
MKKFLLTSKRIALMVFAIIITSSVANATTYFSIATGNWNANTTWSLTSGGAAVGAGVYPVAGDVVNIEGGDNVTIPAGFSAFCTTLNVANSTATGTGTLTFTATGALTVSGSIVVGQAGSNSREGTINMSAGGTLTCGGNVTIGNDGTSTPTASEITQGAGSSVSVTGNVSILAPANNNFTNQWVVNAGTATITGTLSMANPTAGRACTFSVSTGTATVTGAVTMAGAATENNLIVSGAGTLNLGSSISTSATGTFTLGAGSTVDYEGAAQTVRAATYQNLTLSGSGNKTIPAATTVNGKLSLQGTAAAITNAPTYGAASTLEYKGSAAQTATAIEFPAANGPASLTIDNTAGVTLLNAARTLTGTLTLTNGVLTIPAAATPNLILNASPANAIAGTFGATTHIKAATSGANSGLIRVNNITVSSPYTFPVGDGTYYLPVQLTSGNTLANNSFSVGVFDGVTANGAPNGTAFTAAQKLKIVDAVWIINYNGTGTPTAPSGVNMRIDWDANLEGASFTANPNALVGIAHYGPSWGTCQQTTANNASNFVTLNGVTTFSPFAVGTINAGGAPLPIKIYYFNASKGNVANTLNWNAECTSSQATFEIERSADGKNFTTINSFTATQARCASPFSYDDAAPLTGTNFYRIKIIDIDGRINYTSIVKVGAQVRDMQLAGILPNPVSNTAQLSITTSKKDKVELAIVSLEGKVVYRNTVQVQSGSSLVSMDVSNLATGTYFVRGVFSDGQTNSVKFVKQ